MSSQKDDTYHHRLATMVLLCFLLVCAIIMWIITMNVKIEAVVAGILGGILATWSSSLNQVTSYFFGSSQSSKQKDSMIDRMQTTQAVAAEKLAEKVPVAAAPSTKPIPVVVKNKEPVQVEVVPAVWDANAVYAAGDKAVYGGDTFACILAVGPSAAPPPDDSLHWSKA